MGHVSAAPRAPRAPLAVRTCRRAGPRRGAVLRGARVGHLGHRRVHVERRHRADRNLAPPASGVRLGRRPRRTTSRRTDRCCSPSCRPITGDTLDRRRSRRRRPRRRMAAVLRVPAGRPDCPVEQVARHRRRSSTATATSSTSPICRHPTDAVRPVVENRTHAVPRSAGVLERVGEPADRRLSRRFPVRRRSARRRRRPGARRTLRCAGRACCGSSRTRR